MRKGAGASPCQSIRCGCVRQGEVGDDFYTSDCERGDAHVGLFKVLAVKLNFFFYI